MHREAFFCWSVMLNSLQKVMKIQTINVIAVVLATLLAFANTSANSQTSTPDAVVRALYKTHDYDLKHNKDSILSGKSRTRVDKYFDRSLANYIWRDLTTHKDEVGVLDFDPFYNTQDPSISNLGIGGAKLNGNKATVRVTFKNAGRKETIVYRLVKERSLWKISDIEYEQGNSLLKYFKEDETNK